jgi:hypothetical protein
LLLERKKKREKENFVKMKEIKEREREGEISEKLEKLDVLGTRGCVLEVVLLGNEGQAAFALARANCFVISKEYY